MVLAKICSALLLIALALVIAQFNNAIALALCLLIVLGIPVIALVAVLGSAIFSAGVNVALAATFEP